MLTQTIFEWGWKPWLSSTKTGAQTALNLVTGGNTLVGWLPGFWAQTGAVAVWRHGTIGRHKGEAVVPMGGSAERAPTLHYVPQHLPYKWESITENLSHPKGGRLISAEHESFSWLCHLAVTSTDLDWPADPCRPWLSRQTTGVNPRSA